MMQVAQMPAKQWRLMSQSAHDTVAHYTLEHAADLFEKALRTAAERTGHALASAPAGPKVAP